MLASDIRYDLLDAGVGTVEELAQLIEKAFGSGEVWTQGRNVRWYRAGDGFVVLMPMGPDQGAGNLLHRRDRRFAGIVAGGFT